MKYLLQGLESAERMALILSLTKMKSESMTDAICDHLVKGSSEKVACAANGVIQQNFNKSLARLNEIAGKIESIKTLDWHHLSHVKRGNNEQSL